MRLSAALVALSLGCTPVPGDFDLGTFRVSADLAEPAALAADEWREATGGRLDWQIVATDDPIEPYEAWTISIVPSLSDGALGRTGGCAIVVRSGVPLDDMRVILLHELGHVAGLGHGPTGTIMCDSLRCASPHVTDRDLERVNDLH